MGLTPEQLVRRRKHLGSSDMAAVLGLDPYRTRYDVWLEKTEKLEDEPEKDTEPQKRGKFLEHALLDYIEYELGSVNRTAMEILHPNNIILDHPDGKLIADNRPIEAKSVGMYTKEQWGQPGTDEVPDRVVIQCQVHIDCCNADYCYIPVYLPIKEFQTYGVVRDEEIINVIRETSEEFWSINVKKDIPPEVSPSLSYAKRIRRTPDIIDMTVPDEIVSAKLEADKALSLAKKAQEQANADILAAMGQAEIAKFNDGTVTYKKYHSKGGIREIKPYDYRRLYVKKNK